MQRNYVILLFILLIQPVIGFSQTYNGKLVDNKGNPIAYVTIGLKDKNYNLCGLITNEKGVFSIHKKALEFTDSINFSCIGYCKTKVAVSDLSETKINQFILKKAEYNIEEVIITPHKQYVKTLGSHKNHTDAGDFYPIENEVALFIPNNKNIFGYLKNIKIKLTNKPKLKIPIQIHIYSVNKTTLEPYMELLTKFLLADTKNYKNKWITIDVFNQKIKFPKEGLFIGVQFLPKKDLVVDSLYMLKGRNLYLDINKPLRIQRGYVSKNKKSNTWVRCFKTNNHICSKTLLGGKWYYMGNKGYYHPKVGETDIIMSADIIYSK